MSIDDYQKIFHEIKNNVTFISSSLQFVEKKHPHIKNYSSWTDAMEEVDVLKKMLIELSSARLTDNANLTLISVNDFLADFSHSCKSIFNEPIYHYRIDCDENLADFCIDISRLKRALFNLIKNAFEAMNNQGEVKIHIYQKDTDIVFDVIDTGGGIAPEYLEKIFTPFETTKETGTGLGLLITKQIVNCHNGHITIDSRLGDGCTFSVHIPIHVRKN